MIPTEDSLPQAAEPKGAGEEERRQPLKSRKEWLERITAKTAAIMNDGRTSKELLDELYDETGLPK